jgi:hypothetical protein
VRIHLAELVRVLLPLAVACAAGAAERAGGEEAKCADCHLEEGKDFSRSIHVAGGLNCPDCHGGESSYMVTPAVLQESREWASSPAASQPATSQPSGTSQPAIFDHGPQFTGRPTHRQVPERCGTCHSDVSRMNPYGLPTDQLAQYKTSGHGRALYAGTNDRVAVCTSCHSKHAIVTLKNPESPVYPRNVPATCGGCHGNSQTMADTNLNTRVLAEYRESVHGVGLLEKSDLGMPNCATCHGSHSAVPPGFTDVGHVCGRCHQQEEQRFLESTHAKFPLFPRCVGCHTRSPDKRDHRIFRVAASPADMEKAYQAALRERPGGDINSPEFQAAYSAAREPHISPFQDFCLRCHAKSEEVGHRMFFGQLDQQVMKMGDELYRLIRGAELRYAATASKVDRARFGVLMLTDEALMVEELRTKVVALAPLQHTLDVAKVQKAVTGVEALSDQTEQSLGAKLRDLRWRHWALLPIWLFLMVFIAALWAKYRRLERAMVVPWTKER